MPMIERDWNRQDSITNSISISSVGYEPRDKADVGRRGSDLVGNWSADHITGQARWKERYPGTLEPKESVVFVPVVPR